MCSHFSFVVLKPADVGSCLLASAWPLSAFEVAGSGMPLKKAKAVRQGNQLIVSSEEVGETVAVCYGWKNRSIPSLFNEEGLPASPFTSGLGVELFSD